MKYVESEGKRKSITVLYITKLISIKLQFLTPYLRIHK